MNNYTYNGTSILSFTHNGEDYIVFGKGPHALPEDSELVQTLVAKGDLVPADKPVDDASAVEKTKVKNY